MVLVCFDPLLISSTTPHALKRIRDLNTVDLFQVDRRYTIPLADVARSLASLYTKRLPFFCQLLLPSPIHPSWTSSSSHIYFNSLYFLSSRHSRHTQLIIPNRPREPDKGRIRDHHFKHNNNGNFIMATAAEADLARMGYKSELPRSLSMMSVLGL